MTVALCAVGDVVRGGDGVDLRRVRVATLDTLETPTTRRPGNLTVADVYMIVGCLSATIRTDSGDWRRLVDLTLDRLRPRGS
ncbi:hypothetical protein [Kitasatospora sp. McL0602]|uniref:hypothetical protein n=1 Tax=Kitasatospora sp. McL0602 TaxID=3439530 RepID=UPI003F8A8F2C